MAAALTATGAQPTIAISDHKIVTPIGGTKSITGGAPVVTATDHQVARPGSAALSTTTGVPTVVATNHKLATPITAPVSITGGTPTVTIAAAAVSFVAASTTNSNSITIPAHTAGDLIIIIASQTGVSAYPTKPAASGNVPNWVLIDQTQAFGAMVTYQFVAVNSSTASGTWSGADVMSVVVVRGQHSTPIGGHAISANAGTNMTAPSVTLANSDGTSMLLHFYSCSSLGANWPSAPSGYTFRSNSGGLNTKGGAALSKNVSTSDGSVILTNGAGLSAYQTASVEIRAH
ncbi:hypothetical protein [Mycolicibacterium houstonense]|uniref:hypothetical protein n=1 Tax=Mycolicibacterium houstonense TaxID=146021 RepID=UPI0013589829|nr:hypothetical protein [Mycolicibacterium houstonense]